MQQSAMWPARTFEDVLGPAEGRYFGSGYRAVAHLLERNAGIAPTCGFDGTAKLTYPTAWSRGEGGVVRQPHLSTIDAVVLPLMALETHTLADGGLVLDSFFVERIDLRAGSEPWLDLGAVPVKVSLVSHDGEETSSSLHFDAVTGNIRARLTLQSRTITNLITLPSSARPPSDVASTYASLYRTNESKAVLAGFDPDAGLLTATHTFHTTAALTPDRRGIEKSFWPALTVVDYLVTMGQLAQTLIALRYGDGRSGELWMRRLSITVRESPLALPATIETRTILTKDRVIDRGGRRYRDVAIDSRTSNGVNAEAMLAYMGES